jgi:hypothetical protein
VSADRRNLADLNDLIRNAQPSRSKRVMLAVTRFAVTFCIGIAATLAWQPYGDAAREMIASSSPQLGWLAPQSAAAQDRIAQELAKLREVEQYLLYRASYKEPEQALRPAASPATTAAAHKRRPSTMSAGR